MGALQYVHVPGYAALILRKDTSRLALAGGLIPRSHEWLAGKARWNEARRTWTFPQQEGPPATITFGYLSRPTDKFRYASSEFQYIAFDELTELREEDYLFLFSRLRKAKLLAVPLRIRSASNPGNIGHLWVKERFIEQTHENRRYIPSLIADNPHLAADEYRQSLTHLMPVTRERLMNGDWSVQERGIFRPEWLRHYGLSGKQFDLYHPGGSLFLAIPQNACRFFITVDPAGTSDDSGSSDQRSFSVIQVWAQPRSRELSHFLLLREQIRDQTSLAALCRRISKTHAKWQTEKVWIEDEKLGHGLVTDLRKETPPVPAEPIPTRGRSKEARAIPLANKLERGEVFLPKYDDSWRPGFERELLAWTGDKREVSDQIDAAAYAAIIAESGIPGVIVMERIVHA